MCAYVEFKDVKKVYKTGEVEIHALRDVNFEIEKGEFCVIVGASGAGKTTILNILGGMDTLTSGSVKLAGEEISRLNKRQLTAYRRYDVGFVFQFYNLVQNLTALENVQIKNRITQHTDQQTILSWFERLGIADKVDSKVGLMSFGQQQRVAMMRALVQPFDFIVADEPISHLDDHNSDIMAQLMLEEAGKQGAAVVVTSIGKHMKIDYDRVVLL